MTLGIHRSSGFVAYDSAPRPDNPLDWVVWHFTNLEYLDEITDIGALLCDDLVSPRAGSVANEGVKARRRERLTDGPAYPPGRSVSAHVPFYYASKSPMLYVVQQNFPPATVDRLVFLGVRIGDVLEAGLDWVASDGNAAAGITQFSTDALRLGTFINFDTMRAQYWNDTAEFPTRKHQRSAEFLVHQRLPLELVSQVAARTSGTTDASMSIFHDAGFDRPAFRTGQALFY